MKADSQHLTHGCNRRSLSELIVTRQIHSCYVSIITLKYSHWLRPSTLHTLHTPFTTDLNVSGALQSGLQTRNNSPLLIMMAEIVLNALTASAMDRTTVSPHAYPIE